MKHTITPKYTGVELARATLTHILEHPRQWKQSQPPSPGHPCGCFMHHACVIGRINPFGGTSARQKALGIDQEQYRELYDGGNTLKRLKQLCRRIFGIKSVTLSSGKRVLCR